MSDNFDPVLGGLVAPALERLTARLGSVPGLAGTEREAVRSGLETALVEALQRKATRVLVLELHAARLAGQLTAPDPHGRWQEWLSAADRPGFWESLSGRYPTLLPRLHQLITNRCATALELARRFAADRSAVSALLPPGDPTLGRVEFGAGDSHRGGHTVAILRCAAGPVVYKPRPLQVDAALGRLLPRLLTDEPPPTRIRVPEVVCRDGYGWAGYVDHRYCTGDAELRAFYRGIGQWIAVMRLLGGRDLHAENLIAAGPVPVVVDCETLFTPLPAAPPSGYGLAVDRASQLVANSVLATGLLPGRGRALAWRGVDVSGAGALPGQQPVTSIPVLVDAGTDQARIGFDQAPPPAMSNRPTPEPEPGRYWSQVVEAFEQLTEQLRGRDRDGKLADLLAEFADCQVRLVLRATESYAELGRMLWHPTSLYDEPTARRRAAELLARHAENAPEAPADPGVIEQEVADLLVGDIPFFTTTPRAGWHSVPDLLADALQRWRHTDLELDRQVIRATLVSAYLDDGRTAASAPLKPRRVRGDRLDQRRRQLAAEVMRTLLGTAVRAEDRTATWIAPVLTAVGWTVEPLPPDLYGGTHGLANLLAGYLGEVRAGRAEPVERLPELLPEVLNTIVASERQDERDRTGDIPIRPTPPGGYTGLGSQIWSWLRLGQLGGCDPDQAVSRTRAIAAQVAESALVDERDELLSGAAGAIVPLLRLAESDPEGNWSTLASAIGQRLGRRAESADGIARWPRPLPLGGMAHGATGIGWALSRLAHATGDRAAGQLAEAAFRYEESLYDPALPGWRDVRKPATPVDMAQWCHGAGGIGIAAADLLRHTGEPEYADRLRRAAAVCWSSMGTSHTLCHGYLGNWEVVRAAIDAGLGPADLDRERLDAYVLSSLADFGAVTGPNRDAFRPGLLLGLGGIAYQLLRMHPDCPLPSVLLPDPGRQRAELRVARGPSGRA